MFCVCGFWWKFYFCQHIRPPPCQSDEERLKKNFFPMTLWISLLPSPFLYSKVSQSLGCFLLHSSLFLKNIQINGIVSWALHPPPSSSTPRLSHIYQVFIGFRAVVTSTTNKLVIWGTQTTTRNRKGITWFRPSPQRTSLGRGQSWWWWSPKGPQRPRWHQQWFELVRYLHRSRMKLKILYKNEVENNHKACVILVFCNIINWSNLRAPQKCSKAWSRVDKGRTHT